MKPGPKRTPDQVLRDRAETARLYLQGVPQHEIAAKQGVTREQITYDLNVIRAEWVKNAQEGMTELVARELAKLDRIEAEAWAAWERSCKSRERKRTKKTTGGESDRLEAQVETEERDGDPRWLEIVAKCVDQRCKLRGLNAPQKHEHQVTSVDERRDRLAAILASLRERIPPGGNRNGPLGPAGSLN